ncbi:MAG TPA: hypothetical protein VF575_05120 [Candidatus Saccharimonadales bacterium]|jgi:hypothetical protein
MINNPFSARESGLSISRGAARATEFPGLVEPSAELIPKGLPGMFSAVEESGFMFDRKFMPGVSDLALEAELIEISDHGKTREESGHLVFFGQLLLNADDEGEHSLHVAVKPFDNVREAAQEYAVESYFAEGKVPQCETFTPLGVTRLPEGQIGIVSHYRHSVRSMDGIFWNEDLVTDSDITRKALGRAGVSLGLLHSAGWTHGDAQVKNVAWDVTRPFDSTIVPDLEDARPVNHLGRIEQDELKERDLDTFISSLFQLQEAGYKLPYDYGDQIKEHFGIVYTGTNQNISATKSAIDISVIARIVDRNI